MKGNMLRKTVTYILSALALLVFCGYLAVASLLSERGREKEVCRQISVRILDSAMNRFVSKEDIRDIITASEVNPIGRLRRDVRLKDIETLLENRSAIRRGEASLGLDGTLHVDITQRRPLVRIQTGQGAFYLDDTGYIFPWTSTFTSYVPVVSGHIPVRLEEGYRGVPEKSDRKWVSDMIVLARYLDRHPVWNSQIQQIYIEPNGDITFYTVVGDQKIIFGGIEDIDYKFAKLKAYYTEIVPAYGWEKYSTVNLKFSDQIVCSKRSAKDIRKSVDI